MVTYPQIWLKLYQCRLSSRGLGGESRLWVLGDEPMVDILHLRDGQPMPGLGNAKATPGDATSEVRRQERPPRSDVGTIILHWATAIALVVCLVTGLRVATFGHVAPRFSQSLSPILPQGEMWTWHFFAGLSLFFCASAYLLYIMRSGLSARNALKKLRVMLMPVAAKMRWQAVNIGLHWFVYALITVMTVTGIILYLGYGGWWVWIHSIAAFIGFGYIFLHVLTHYLY